MATIHIELPDELQNYAESQVQAGRYVDVSDFVRDVLRDRHRAQEELDRLLLEGEASGLSERSVEEIIADAKSRWLAHRPN
jgi:antitoxin ParD1/3/4